MLQLAEQAGNMCNIQLHFQNKDSVIKIAINMWCNVTSGLTFKVKSVNKQSHIMKCYDFSYFCCCCFLPLGIRSFLPLGIRRASFFDYEIVIANMFIKKKLPKDISAHLVSYLWPSNKSICLSYFGLKLLGVQLCLLPNSAV